MYKNVSLPVPTSSLSISPRSNLCKATGLHWFPQWKGDLLALWCVQELLSSVVKLIQTSLSREVHGLFLLSHCFSFLSCFLKPTPSVIILTLPTSPSKFGLQHLDHSSTLVHSISEMLQICLSISLFPFLPQSDLASEKYFLPSSASLPNSWL